MNLVCKFMASPVGKLKLVASEKGLVAILWENDDPRRVVLDDLKDDDRQPILVETERQLKEYFEGKRQDFSIPLDMRGTPFQIECMGSSAGDSIWRNEKLRPAREATWQPECCACDWRANGRNPLSIVVPCHRVIGSSGELTGFAGGLETKAQLLKIESQSRGPHSK